MASTATAAMVNFLMRTSSKRARPRMSAPQRAINLQFGQSALSYQDVIWLPFIKIKAIQIIPSSRGSHSEISGT